MCQLLHGTGFILTQNMVTLLNKSIWKVLYMLFLFFSIIQATKLCCVINLTSWIKIKGNDMCFSSDNQTLLVVS